MQTGEVTNLHLILKILLLEEGGRILLILSLDESDNFMVLRKFLLDHLLH